MTLILCGWQYRTSQNNKGESDWQYRTSQNDQRELQLLHQLCPYICSIVSHIYFHRVPLGLRFTSSECRSRREGLHKISLTYTITISGMRIQDTKKVSSLKDLKRIVHYKNLSVWYRNIDGVTQTRYVSYEVPWSGET